MPLLPPDLLPRLAGLELALRRALPSALRGDRRAPLRKGISLEFADHRPYVPGDDVRHLDWSAWARLDQLVVKLYHDEEDLQLHILLDDSASMASGAPSKASFARSLSAALCWIGLATRCDLRFTLLGETAETRHLGRDPAAFPAALELLEQPPQLSKVPLSEALRSAGGPGRLRGAVILLSDLLDPAGPSAALRELQRRETEVFLIQILAAEELDPVYEGDLRFLDSESGEAVEVSLTPTVLEAYRRTARQFVGTCAAAARGRGAAYALATSHSTLEDFLLKGLVSEGVLR